MAHQVSDTAMIPTVGRPPSRRARMAGPTRSHDDDPHLDQRRRIGGSEVGSYDRATPTSPMSMPSRPTGPNVRAPGHSAIAAPTSGTPAMRRAASELEICCSAEPSATQGTAISTAANATTQRQLRRTGRRSVRANAIGSRMAAAVPFARRPGSAGVISVDRDPNEEIGDAPDNRHQGEQEQRPAAHAGRFTGMGQSVGRDAEAVGSSVAAPQRGRDTRQCSADWQEHGREWHAIRSAQMSEPDFDRPRLFASYGHQDSELVQPVVRAIEAAGVDVWVDVEQLQAGVDWAGAIDDALVRSIILVFLSPEYVASHETRLELGVVARRGGLIIPVMIEPVDIKKCGISSDSAVRGPDRG